MLDLGRAWSQAARPSCNREVMACWIVVKCE
jgi:hypothetical protein